MTSAEIAWLAGLLEGEGFFVLQKGRWPSFVIGLDMTDEDIVARAARLMGVASYHSIKRDSHRKRQYRVRLTGKRAIVLARQLYPWLGERRQARIDEIIDQLPIHDRSEAQRRSWKERRKKYGPQGGATGRPKEAV